MAYIALARKWRPAQFEDIVGQGAVVQTLMNSIRSERIHHAYLFTGTRGIGKTSIARIFSKAIRCESLKIHEHEGVNWLRTCEVCSPCVEMQKQNGVDVLEIDGASNNGVDAVREIRENAKYHPATGSKKVYIIDEVHMLTTAAWNALLKTLEEPPEHVIFIFATTEPHKIPATILSRVQRFDCRRVSAKQVMERLSLVLKDEGTSFEPSALSLIARAANGSMRDGLSLLDQVLAFCGSNLTVQATRDSLGLIGADTIFSILSTIVDSDPKSGLEIIERVFESGYDLKGLTEELIDGCHELILRNLGAPIRESQFIGQESEVAELSQKRELWELEAVFQILHHGLEWVARSSQPKLVLDVLLIKCASSDGWSPAHGGEKKSKSAVSPRASGQTDQPTAPFRTTEPKTFEGFIHHVRQKRPLLATLLENATTKNSPISATENHLILGFRESDSYYYEQLKQQSCFNQLAQLATEYYGFTVLLKVEFRVDGESLAEKRQREVHDREEDLKNTILNHPIIVEAKSLFGGEIEEIRHTNHGA